MNCYFSQFKATREGRGGAHNQKEFSDFTVCKQSNNRKMLVGIVDSNLQISYQNIIVQHIKSLQEFLKGSVYFLQNYKLVNMKFSIFHPTFLFQSTWLTEGLRHVAVMDVHLWSCIIMKIVVIILYTVSCYRLDSTRLTWQNILSLTSFRKQWLSTCGSSCWPLVLDCRWDIQGKCKKR